ncbi:MAG: hypothetical protein AAFQ68_23550, partial [Bacteroidota bacterium]
MKIHLWLILSLGILWMSCGEEDQALSEQTEAVAPTPVDDGPEAQLLALNKQIEMSPKSYQLFEQRSQIYYQIDSLPQAVLDINKAIELFPNGADLYYLRGFYAFVQDDSIQAMKDYLEAARLGSEEPENYYQMGQLHFFNSNDELALRLYKQAEELAPKEPIYIFAQGFLYETRGRKQEALREYLRSLEADSSFAKTRLQLHDLYLDGYKNEPAAVEQVRELLLFEPTQPLARFYMGNFHMRKLLANTDESLSESFKEEANEAVMHFSIAINKSPQFLQALYNRGFVYFLAQNIDKALVDFVAAIYLDP